MLLVNACLASAVAWAASESKPDPTLWDLNKKPQKLSQYRGKIVILNFWATWCVSCKTELPMLVEEQKRYRHRGVVVVAASVDDATTVAKVKPYVKQKDLNFPVWLGATVDTLGTLELGQAVPATAFFDQEGNLVGRVKGILTQDDLEHRIQWLLGNREGTAPEPVVDNLSPR